MECNKIPYETKKDAAADVTQILYARRFRGVKSRKDNRKLTPYICPRCGKWHLTSRSKRKYD